MTNVIPLPGVNPRAFVNENAAKDLEEVVELIRAGHLAGFAIVTVQKNGNTGFQWSVPTGMGRLAYVGVQSMAFEMMRIMRDV